jgi:hypothetical protein
MAVFAVLPNDPQSAVLIDRVGRAIPQGSAIRLLGGAWLIAYTGTSRELSDALGITVNPGPSSDLAGALGVSVTAPVSGTPIGGVVCSISSYWGHATKDVWEWLQGKV